MTDDGGPYYPLALSNLPAGWVYGYVGEFIPDVQSGFASGEHNDQGLGIPHLRPMNIDRLGRLDLSTVKFVVDKTHARLERGDVIFNNTNSPELVGKTTVLAREGEFAFSNHMTRLRPPDSLSPAFVAHQLHYLWARGYFRHRCTNHVNQASISSKTLSNSVPLIVPPRPDQDAIVAELEKHFTRLDAAVAILTSVQAKLRAYRAAILNAAVHGRLVPNEAEYAAREGRSAESGVQLLMRILEARRRQWQAARSTPYKEPLQPPGSDTPLPPGWTWASVDQLTQVLRPCAYGVLQPGDEVQGGTPMVRVGDIDDGVVDVTNLKTIDPRIADQYSRTRLRGGEVLLTLVGSIGKTAVVPRMLAGANIARAVGVLPLCEEVVPEWVEVWFRNPARVAFMTAQAHEVARKTLNLEDVKRALVALPPVAEQHRIVAEVEGRITSMRRLAADVRTAMSLSERLRSAVLQAAFAGRLRSAEPQGMAIA